jgi:hypothetical protein
MNEPRRVLIGAFPAGVDVHAFGEDIGGALLAAAAARLDAERAAIRPTLTVDREWFIAAMRELTFSLEVRWKLANRRSDYDRRAVLARKLRRLRVDIAEVLDSNERPQR